MSRTHLMGDTPLLVLTRHPFREEHARAYLRREHAKGRHLADVLNDPMIERLGGAAFVWHVLLRPETIAALQTDVTDAIRACATEIAPGSGDENEDEAGPSQADLLASSRWGR